jgi:hypothetical protein
METQIYRDTIKLSPMQAGFFQCALWSSGDDDDPVMSLAENYTLDDIDPVTFALLCVDCETFERNNRAVIDSAALGAEQVGHDFWLTRNHIGAVFWDDADCSERNRILTDSAHGFGEVALYAYHGAVYSES